MGTFAPIGTGLSPACITQMRQLGERYPYQEVIAIYWGGTRKWYANDHLNYAPFDNIFTLIDIAPDELEVRLEENVFAEFEIAPITEDTSASFEFLDDDNHFTDLHNIYGAGSRVEIYGYWPTVDAEDPNGLLLLRWWGILGKPEDSSDEIKFVVKAKAGIRSPKLNLPRRIIYPGCPKVFGGEVDPISELPILNTQALIDEHGCPYNRHLEGGTVGELDGGEPFTHCPRLSMADCILRLGTQIAIESYGGITDIQPAYQVGFSQGANTGRMIGNPSIVRKALPVVYGISFVGDISPVSFRPSPFEKDHTRVWWPIREGPVDGFANQWGTFFFRVEDKYVSVEKHVKQPGFARAPYRIDNGSTGQVSGFSFTAYAITDLKNSDFPNWNPQQTKASCLAHGLKTVRHYTDAETYTEQWSSNRAWCLLDLLTNKRYGLGLDRGLFVMDDWISLGAWCDHNAYLWVPIDAEYPGVDPEGGGREREPLEPWFVPQSHEEPTDTGGDPPSSGPSGYTLKAFRRSTLNVTIQERRSQEVIHDICAGGNIGTPFFWGGKIRVMALGLQDTSAFPPQIFTKEAEIYGFKNIEDDSLKASSKEEDEVVNLLKYNISLRDKSMTDLFIEQPLVFEDRLQQLLAGLVNGDTTIRVTEKSATGFGITNLHEGLRMGAIVFEMGELESGGASNNVTVRFTTWDPGSDGIQLHPWKLIEIKDAKLQARYKQLNGDPFKYFRVRKLKRGRDLKLQVEAQGYSEVAYQNIELGEYTRPLPFMLPGVLAPRLPIQAPRAERPESRRDGSRVVVKGR